MLSPKIRPLFVIKIDLNSRLPGRHRISFSPFRKSNQRVNNRSREVGELSKIDTFGESSSLFRLLNHRGADCHAKIHKLFRISHTNPVHMASFGFDNYLLSTPLNDTKSSRSVFPTIVPIVSAARSPISCLFIIFKTKYPVFSQQSGSS